MPRRRRSFPPDDVTAAEWLYLSSRYAPDEAEERGARVAHLLKRLVRKGHDPAQLHRALMGGVDQRTQHEHDQAMVKRTQQHNRNVERARKDVAQALASLRRLIPQPIEDTDTPAHLTDDRVFAMREVLLTLRPVTPRTNTKRGRPWGWKQDADDALRAEGVIAADRRELLSALGFIDPE